MTWQLRAIAGPLEGAVYPLVRRVSLGRASDCDIQIINDGVSRRHAKVVPTPAGHIVVDLRSNNGTFVGEQRVREHELRPGDEVRIMLSRFVYERAPEQPPPPGPGVSGVWAVKVTSGITLRQTVDHMTALKLPGAMGSRAPAPGDTEEDFDPYEQRSRRRKPTPVPLTQPEQQRIRAVDYDGVEYEGDLLGDIECHRALQLRMTRGDTLAPAEIAALSRLSRRFRQPEASGEPFAGLRRFVRFQCGFPARLRWLTGTVARSDSVLIRDLGVGGSRVASKQALTPGAVAWLVFDLVAAQRPRTLVFPTRVAWSEAGELGLQFAGTVESQPHVR